MTGDERASNRIAGLGVTIFTEMTELAARTRSLNLGQGVPDGDGPPMMIEAARRALLGGANQYPPLGGTSSLREAVCRQRREDQGTSYDPSTQIVITTGATEAVTAAVLGLCDPDDEIVVFDPAYDSYAAAARLAGARLRRVPLLHSPDGFHYDPAALRAAITPNTKMLLLNTPHNPTGKVFTPAELEDIAEVCLRHDLVAVVDEVYEHLVYDDREHLSLSALDEMAHRTLIVSSAGKTFSVTGWKVGWACGPADLVAAVRSVKQYTTFASAAPLQDAVALGLNRRHEWLAIHRKTLQSGRDLLAAGLRSSGLDVLPARSGYFLQADLAGSGVEDALEYCRALPHKQGVVAIPTQAFAARSEPYASLVRFAFCKSEETLREAARRLAHQVPGRAHH